MGGFVRTSTSYASAAISIVVGAYMPYTARGCTWSSSTTAPFLRSTPGDRSARTDRRREEHLDVGPIERRRPQPFVTEAGEISHRQRDGPRLEIDDELHELSGHVVHDVDLSGKRHLPYSLRKSVAHAEAGGHGSQDGGGVRAGSAASGRNRGRGRHRPDSPPSPHRVAPGAVRLDLGCGPGWHSADLAGAHRRQRHGARHARARPRAHARRMASPSRPRIDPVRPGIARRAVWAAQVLPAHRGGTGAARWPTRTTRSLRRLAARAGRRIARPNFPPTPRSPAGISPTGPLIVSSTS